MAFHLYTFDTGDCFSAESEEDVKKLAREYYTENDKSMLEELEDAYQGQIPDDQVIYDEGMKPEGAAAKIAEETGRGYAYGFEP